MRTRVTYRFIGSLCDHQHPEPPSKDDPFTHGWEHLVLAFRSRDWFSGPVNAFLKAECAKLGIPWLSFRPHSKPTAFAIVLATQMNAQLPQVSDEEHEQSWGMWAVLEQGASIFQNTCVVPSCANYDALAHLVPVLVDVTIHAPSELCNMLLSDLYDWNHAGAQGE